MPKQRKAKAKPKEEKVPTKEQPNRQNEIHQSNLTKYSLDLICLFDKLLKEKFTEPTLTELESERKSYLKKLFLYLCYGLQ